MIVTGGCGFVGSSLVRSLVADEVGEVFVLDDLSLGSARNLGPAEPRAARPRDVRDRDATVAAIARPTDPRR